MGSCCSCQNDSLYEKVPHQKHKLNERNIAIICERWAALLKLDGFVRALTEIIVDYTYLEYIFVNTANITELPHYDCSFTLAILGDEQVGKTMISSQFVDGTFSDSYVATVLMNRESVLMESQLRNIRYLLRIMDYSGQKRFIAATTSYLGMADGVLMVFDITNRDSFENVVDLWTPKLESHCQDHTIVQLVGSKIDMKNDRKVSAIEAKQLSESLGFIEYVEVSSKKWTNLDYCFNHIVQRMIAERKLRRPVLAAS